MVQTLYLPMGTMSWEDLGIEADSDDSNSDHAYFRGYRSISDIEESYSLTAESSISPVDKEGVDSNADYHYSVYKSYFYGQIANVIKASIIWSMFGVIMALYTQSDYGISCVRLIFNLSLILSSPFSSILAKRTNIKKILIGTTLTRTLIWSFLVPLFWFFFSYRNNFKRLFLFLFLGFMFTDGLQVSFSNTVDIDCGGFDSLSFQYDIPITYIMIHKLNNIQQIIFDLSFVLISLPVSCLFYFISHDYPQYGDLILPIGVSSVFLILSAISLYYYLFGLPRYPCQQYRNQLLSALPCSIKPILLQNLKDALDGFKIVIKNRIMLFRLLFLTIETAFDDCLISLIMPYTAIRSPWFKHSNLVRPNLISVFLIALGKLGGIVGIYIIQITGVTIDSSLISCLKMFRLLILSMTTILLLPFSLELFESFKWEGWPCVYTFGLILFLFFLFNSMPKIWLSNLLQHIVSNHEHSDKIHNFISHFITLVDALLLLGLNYVILVPNEKGYFPGMLYFTAGLYCIYGLIHIVIGPLTLY